MSISKCVQSTFRSFIQAWRIHMTGNITAALALFTAYQIIGTYNARLSGRRAAEIGGNYRDPDSGPFDKTERIKLTQWWGDLFCFGFWFWEQSFSLQVCHFDQQCNYNALILRGTSHRLFSACWIFQNCDLLHNYFFQVNLNYNESRSFNCLGRWQLQKN